MTMTFKITATNSVNFIYKDHSFRVFKPKTKGQDLKALTKLFNHCESMLSHYSKVLVARIELSTKTYSKTNHDFLKFIKQQVEILTKQYKSKVSYICARERNTSSNHHYHLAILLSGHKINHSNKLTHQLKEAWESQGLGSASFVKHPYYIMERGNKLSIEPALYRLSYLTKRVTKETNIKAHSYLFNKLPYSSVHDSRRFSDILLVNPAVTYQQQKANTSLVKSCATGAGGMYTDNSTEKYTDKTLAHYKAISIAPHTDHFRVANNFHLTKQHSMHRKNINKVIDHFI